MPGPRAREAVPPRSFEAARCPCTTRHQAPRACVYHAGTSQGRTARLRVSSALVRFKGCNPWLPTKKLLHWSTLKAMSTCQRIALWINSASGWSSKYHQATDHGFLRIQVWAGSGESSPSLPLSSCRTAASNISKSGVYSLKRSAWEPVRTKCNSSSTTR